ncbi:MAG: hypothetical protein QXN26_06960 [Thermoplasmataceae archaeon]
MNADDGSTELTSRAEKRSSAPEYRIADLLLQVVMDLFPEFGSELPDPVSGFW